MSRDQEQSEVPVESVDDLVAYFHEGCKADASRGVGTEHEKFPVWADSLEPVSYEGERGLGRVFGELAQQFGWTPDYDQNNVLALVDSSDQSDGAITLEPGGQFELSGAVRTNVHDTATELDRHLAHCKWVGEVLGIRWLGAGTHPLSDIDQIPWMPKSRYGIMAPYLGSRGGLAHHMMKGTCTIQANFDYTSEADAGELVHLGVRLSPLISAIFANSPLLGGRVTGHQTFRCHIWTDTDPDRSGTPPFMLNGPFRFEEYANYILDIPMMFIRREGSGASDYIDLHALPFRSFMTRGFEGHRATIGDWELHLSACFPELRIKQFVEVRGADGGNRAAILALPALWKGILYDDDARAAASALVGPMTSEEQLAHFNDMTVRGLQATWRGDSLLTLATRLVAIAGDGLDRQRSDHRPSERVYLDPLADRLLRGESSADQMLSVWQTSGRDRRALAEFLDLTSN